MLRRFALAVCTSGMLFTLTAAVAAIPQSRTSSAAATDINNAECAPLHQGNSYCDGTLAPQANPAPSNDMREATFEVQICKPACSARALVAPPITAKLVTFVGTSAKMLVRRDGDRTKNAILDGYRLQITPSANTDEVAIHVAIDADAATLWFESDSVIKPGKTQSLGNDRWQILVTRTE